MGKAVTDEGVELPKIVSRLRNRIAGIALRVPNRLSLAKEA